MTAAARLTPAQLRALRGLRDHDDAAWGLRTMQQYGGLVGTMAALRRRGLIDHGPTGYRLTDAGREAAQ